MTGSPNRTGFFAAALLALLTPGMAGVFAPAAQAQFSASYNFLKAVRDRDGTVASGFLNEPGSTIVDTRDRKTGDTALHIVTERRDSTWMEFLLQKQANPNIANSAGLTPLMLATQLRYVEGVEVLLRYKARVDETNRSGETALIRAVQLRDVELVKLLIKSGANPDRTDSVAGLSARDYAERDQRGGAIAQALDGVSASKPLDFGKDIQVFGPQD
jgi:ankyrin repeat protein